MSKKQIAVVVGNADEAVRVVPFLLAQRQDGADFDCLVLSAGPHSEKATAQLLDFDLKPDDEAGYQGTEIFPCELAGRGLTRLGVLLSEKKPELVLIAGESDAALAAATAAFHLNTPVGYINESDTPSDARQADLQSRRKNLLLRMASLQSVPQTRMRLGLSRDGVSPEEVIVTGRFMADAISLLGKKWVYGARAPEAPKLPAGKTGRGQVLVLSLPETGITHAAVADFCLALRDLAKSRPQLEAVIPLPPFAAVRKIVARVLESGSKVSVVDDASLSDRVHLLRRSTLVLSASLKADLYAAALGIPALELPSENRSGRKQTSDVAQSSGAGGNRARIVARVVRLLDDPVALHVLAGAENPYGDGLSGTRLMQAVSRLLAGRTPLINSDDEFVCGPKPMEPTDWREAEALLPAPEMLSS